MEKILKLMGIRQRAILCRSKIGHNDAVVVMEAITKEQELQLDNENKIDIAGKIINKNIYLYGEIDLNNEEELDIIENLNLIGDKSFIHSNINFDTGEVIYENVPKQYETTDSILWFKYNYLLIGKPKRVIVYKINKYEL